MTSREVALELMKENNGLLVAKVVADQGITNKVLQRMEENGEVERVAPGLYMDINYIPDEYFITQYRCPKGIFSYETAFFFHELSDRTPLQLMLTIPTGYNTRLLTNIDYKFFYCKKELWELGKQTLLSPYGNEIVVYNRERTICDCIRKKDKMDKDLVLSAVKQYMKLADRDYAKLLQYAEIFKIRETIRQYMEVLA